MSKISKEVAVEDFERFLTAFRLDPIKRKKLNAPNEKGESIVDLPIELIQEGMVVVKDNGELEYTLLDAIKGENILLEKITFTPKRISVDKLKEISNIKDDIDKMATVLNFLTGVSAPIFKKISTDDMNYLSSIALVFM